MKGPEISAMGYIRIAVPGRGVGANTTTAALDPTHFPSSIQLKDVAWSANSGGTVIPDLVNADVDGVHLRVSTSFLTFPGVQTAEVTLTTADLPPGQIERSDLRCWIACLLVIALCSLARDFACFSAHLNQ